MTDILTETTYICPICLSRYDTEEEAKRCASRPIAYLNLSRLPRTDAEIYHYQDGTFRRFQYLGVKLDCKHQYQVELAPSDQLDQNICIPPERLRSIWLMDTPDFPEPVSEKRSIEHEVLPAGTRVRFTHLPESVTGVIKTYARQQYTIEVKTNRKYLADKYLNHVPGYDNPDNPIIITTGITSIIPIDQG